MSGGRASAAGTSGTTIKPGESVRVFLIYVNVKRLL